MQNLFVSSDHHFGHQSIITKFQFRPFSDCEEMEEELIKRHNSVVKPSDRVVFIGDMFWRSCSDPIGIAKRMNGQMHYVEGNHEEVWLKHSGLCDRFITVTESYKVDLAPYGITEAKYLFCAHFAHRVWPSSHLGSWHAYGHSHGQLPDDPRAKSLDVGVDTHNYYPYSIEEIASHIRAKSDTHEVVPLDMTREQ